jgi:hypothetical protein
MYKKTSIVMASAVAAILTASVLAFAVPNPAFATILSSSGSILSSNTQTATGGAGGVGGAGGAGGTAGGGGLAENINSNHLGGNANGGDANGGHGGNANGGNARNACNVLSCFHVTVP